MVPKKTTAVTVPASEKELAQLANEFPTEPAFNRVFLPRIGMVSQDVTEGKGKAMKVVIEAGTFYIERQTDEVDEATGNKKWERDEIGAELEGIILYQRKQLRHYDEATESYTSSPVYDSDDEILPLWCDKKEVDRGTPKELQSRPQYEGKTAAGKPKSTLENNRILYVLYKGDIYQLNLRGTSMFAYMTFARKVTPNTVVTSFGSEAKEKGSIQWNQMLFTALRKLTAQEVEEVGEKTAEIKQGIAQEKQYFAGQTAEKSEAQRTFDKM